MSLTRNILFSTTSAMLVMSNVALADVTLDTKYGKVTVKDDVKNVVTLHEGALDVMSAINFKVAGSVATRGSDTVSRYLAERQPNIDIVGTARETNLEAVINERPDVILASPSLSQEQYNMLSKIAPTIVPIGSDYSTPFNWKAEARLFGKAVSREADVEKAHKFSTEKFARELLEVVDNLERAIAASPEDEAVKPLLEGVEMTQKTFMSTLAKFKVEVVDPEGHPFDPDLHQAISMVEAPDAEPNTVLNVVQKGYTNHGRLLRPAMVVVSKPSAKVDTQA